VSGNVTGVTADTDTADAVVLDVKVASKTLATETCQPRRAGEYFLGKIRAA
jgi:hypothetical protein